MRSAPSVLLFFVLVTLPASVLAAELTRVEQESAFAIDFLEDVVVEQDFYGELTGFPHTWEFAVSEPTTFRARLSVADETLQNLSVIAIKEERRGVSEVDRITGQRAEWSSYRDGALGLTFYTSGEFMAELTEGVYRFEVSAPANEGRYRLEIGTEADSAGYWGGLTNAFVAHRHFGSGWYGAIASPYVYLTLLGLVLLFGLWRYRRRLFHA